VKRKWWYFIPQLGFTFGLPTVNGGTSTLVQLDVQRQQNRVKLATIISQGMLDYRTDLHKLRGMYQMLEIEEAVVSDSQVNERIYQNLFGIAEEAYQKKETKPIEYNQALLAFQNGVISQEEKRWAYMNKVIEIAQFARYDFPTDSIPELEPLFIEKKPASR
jgi:hypothetical protein